MKKMLSKKIPLAITCWSVILGMLLFTSPAFSMENRAPNDGRNIQEERHDDGERGGNDAYNKRNRSPQVKATRKSGSIFPAVLATGIIAGITLSLIGGGSRDDGTAASVSGTPDSVKVTAALLNVRSGPALGRAPIRQVAGGTVLSVIGTSGGWYRVRTADGVTGWVMVQYTAPVTSPAAG